MTNTKKRIAWIDIAKAYGIIAVVIGHALQSGITTNIIYWWHMPLFFIVGGFFLKPITPTKLTEWKAFFNKRLYRDLLIYFLAGIGLILLYCLVHDESWPYLINHLSRLIIGGRTLNLYTSTFWFINVYLLSITAVTLLISTIKSRWWQFLIVTSALFLGTCYDKVDWLRFYSYKTLPWNLDIVLITVFFTYIGYLFLHTDYHWIEKPENITLLITAAGFIVAGYLSGYLNFRLSLKSHLIEGSLPKVILLATIPLIFSFGIMGLSYVTSQLSGSFILSIIGQHTMIIMYLHRALLDMTALLGIHNIMTQIIIAIIVPMLLTLIKKPIIQHHPPYLEGHVQLI